MNINVVFFKISKNSSAICANTSKFKGRKQYRWSSQERSRTRCMIPEIAKRGMFVSIPDDAYSASAARERVLFTKIQRLARFAVKTMSF